MQTRLAPTHFLIFLTYHLTIAQVSVSLNQFRLTQLQVPHHLYLMQELRNSVMAPCIAMEPHIQLLMQHFSHRQQFRLHRRHCIEEVTEATQGWGGEGIRLQVLIMWCKKGCRKWNNSCGFMLIPSLNLMANGSCHLLLLPEPSRKSHGTAGSSEVALKHLLQITRICPTIIMAHGMKQHSKWMRI